MRSRSSHLPTSPATGILLLTKFLPWKVSFPLLPFFAVWDSRCLTNLRSPAAGLIMTRSYVLQGLVGERTMFSFFAGYTVFGQCKSPFKALSIVTCHNRPRCQGMVDMQYHLWRRNPATQPWLVSKRQNPPRTIAVVCSAISTGPVVGLFWSQFLVHRCFAGVLSAESCDAATSRSICFLHPASLLALSGFITQMPKGGTGCRNTLADAGPKGHTGLTWSEYHLEAGSSPLVSFL